MTEKPPASPAAGSDNPLEILLVEDTPADVELTLHAFEKRHLANRIHVVRDGAEAVDYLFCTGAYAHRSPRDIPRLVLLDLKLPKLDGVEVLRRIRDNPRTELIPVVVLTSSREDRDIIESYRLGANSYIVKPVEFHNFSDAVEQLGYYWLLINQAPPLPQTLGSPNQPP